MGVLKSALASLSKSRQSRLQGSEPAGLEAASHTEADTWAASLAAGRLPDALADVGRVLDRGPDSARLHLARARILRAWGRLPESLDEVRRARSLAGAAIGNVGNVADANVLAWHARATGMAQDAIDWSTRACTLAPDDAEVATALGSALLSAGRFDEAALALERARDLDLLHVDAVLGLAQIHFQQGRMAEAERAMRAALTLDADHPAALRNLAVLLANLDRLDEALPFFTRAEALREDATENNPRVARGIAFCHAARIDEGVDLLARALPEHPDLNGYMQLGPSMLAMGDYAQGWRQFEHRWLIPPLAALRASYGVPQWSGQPLEGRTILVRAEQGIGDMFQFVRYLPMLKARGARVIFQPLRGMDAVARLFPGVDHVLGEGEHLPEFAYFCNVMSLPLAFGTTLDSVPCKVPYIAPDPAYVSKWAPRFKSRDKPRVGIIWAGRPAHLRDRYRSINLEQLKPVLAVPGVQFVSLQKGPAVAQAEAVAESVDWLGLGPELDELDDAAAVISMLDLLICVDTGPMHIAGAMGKPTWMMLPTPADYRWLMDREDSPWYPSLRLFRQPAPMEWAPVIEHVARELASWAATWRPGSPVPTPPRGRPSPRVHARARVAGLALAAETRAGFLQFVPDDSRVGRALEYYGESLQPQLDLALRLIRPGATVIEAEAGVGAHVLPLARAIGAEGLFLAWERRPAIRRLLEQNLATHDMARVTVMTRALEGPTTRGFDAERETVDDLCLSRLDLLKLNDRGDAAAILAGARETLWRCRPAIMVTAPDPGALDRAREMLRDFGYRAWRMDVPLYAPGNFNRRVDDIFGGEAVQALVSIPEEIDLRESISNCVDWP